MHAAAEAVVVIHCQVLGAAIVPERDRVLLPAKAAGEFGAMLVSIKEFKKGLAFLDRHVFKALREVWINE